MQLYTPTEIDLLQQDLPYLIEIMQWVQTFLAKPHPNLGRSGPVCPFVAKSLKSDHIKFTVIRTKNLDVHQLEEIVIEHKHIFLQTEPLEREAAIFKTFLLIFPDISLDENFVLIDNIQRKLKPSFVDLGLMIGEFHKRAETPGLHNPNFRPLQSPVPMLAIRFMVESDLPFLTSAKDPLLRIQYLEAYLRHFQHKIQDAKILNTVYKELTLAREELTQAMSCCTLVCE